MPTLVRPSEFDDPWYEVFEQYLNDVEAALGTLDVTGNDALNIANLANTTANGKNRVYRQPTAPTGGGFVVNDLWFDTDDGNKPYVWNGTAWISAQDAAVTTALNTALAVQTTTDGKNSIFSQPTAPTAKAVNDIWIDTSVGGGNKVNRWNGTAWVSAQDAAIADAKNTAIAAQTTADGRNKVFVQNATPTATAINDTWIDTTGGGNVIKTWNGTSWLTKQFGTAAIAANAITANEIFAGAVVAGKIATDAITANCIQGNAVIAGKIAANAVDADQIAANAITAAKIHANAVTANAIAAGSIVAGDGKIGSLDAGVITVGTLNAAVVNVINLNASNITTGTINANLIAVINLNASNITSGTLSATRISGNNMVLDATGTIGIQINHTATGASNEIATYDTGIGGPSFTTNKGNVLAARSATAGYGWFGQSVNVIQNSGRPCLTVRGFSTGQTQNLVQVEKNEADTTVLVAVPPTGGLVVNNGAALATGATTGFMSIPWCSGAPTGVPGTAYRPTGSVPMVWDAGSSPQKLWVYSGGWKSVAFS